jgi:hypothetical protein
LGSDNSSSKRPFSGIDHNKDFDAIKEINDTPDVQASQSRKAKAGIKSKKSIKSVQKSVDAISKKVSKPTEELKQTIAQPEVQENEIEEAENALNIYQNENNLEGNGDQE